MQLERLLARQMEILQDTAVQERLQALDWRIPPVALKYLNDTQNTNGAAAAADTSRDSQGKNILSSGLSCKDVQFIILHDLGKWQIFRSELLELEK